MKKLLLGFSALMLFFSASAQTYFSEDFESGNLNNWTLIDADGDNNNWRVVTFQNDLGQGKVASSASWNPNSGTPAGPLTPDNWLISQAIDLSSASGTVKLRWAVYAQGQQWPDEKYTVYVATADDTNSLIASPTTFTETLTTSQGYMGRDLDVSSFNGQTIYIAFRHYETRDEFRMNIDDIVVKNTLDHDVALTELNIPLHNQAGNNIPIKGTVKNEGNDTITSLDITWNDGAGNNTQTIAVNIAPNTTYDFTHGTPLVGTTSNSPYTINVCATVTGDQNTSNDCLSQGGVNIYDQLGTRLALLELFTSSTCPPCYSLNMQLFDGSGLNSGLDALNANDQTGANIAAIKYQVNWPGSGDHAYNTEARQRVQKYSVNGAPTPIVNGTTYNYGTFNSSNVSTHQNEVAFINLSGTYSTTSDEITVDVTINPYRDYSGAKLYVALLDKKYDATNAASFSNNETEFHHVFRKFVANGRVINLTSGTAYNSTESTSFNIATGLPAQGSFDLHNGSDREVVLFVEDASGNILNAAIATGVFTASTVENEIENVNIYPNPATDLLNVAFEAKNADYTVSLTDLSGRTMVSNTLTSLSGAQSLALPVADLANGNYILTISSEEGTYTQKVVIK